MTTTRQAPAAPAPSASQQKCGDFTIAYDPTNGYEASAFIIGEIAAEQLDCDVTYVKTTSRRAWRLVARGGADVYMDAYGSPELREELTAEGGPVTVAGQQRHPRRRRSAGPGVHGCARTGQRPGSRTTSSGSAGAVRRRPSPRCLRLVPLATSMVDFLDLDDYEVRDITEVRGRPLGMGYLMQQPREDDSSQAAEHLPGRGSAAAARRRRRAASSSRCPSRPPNRASPTC